MNQFDDNNDPIRSSEVNRPKEVSHSDEDKRTANICTIICLILFFLGPLLITLLFKNKALVEVLGDHIKIACLLLAFMPLIAIVMLANIRHKYPWHYFSAAVMIIFIVSILILTEIIIALLFYFFTAAVACGGLAIECCGVITSLD